MVEAMNAVGFDWVGLGNHEFDLDEADLQKRIDESTFNWLTSNVLANKNGELIPFHKMVDGVKISFPKTAILTFKNAQGQSVKMGMFSVVFAVVVKKWDDIMEVALKKVGMDRNDVVAQLSEPLDGRESTMRNGHTNLGDLIAKAMTAAASKPVDCSIFNSGSVRIDDQLSGRITQLDIMRILPFWGKIVEVNLKGRLLERILESGIKNRGNGGFLQWNKIRHDETKNE